METYSRLEGFLEGVKISTTALILGLICGSFITFLYILSAGGLSETIMKINNENYILYGVIISCCGSTTTLGITLYELFVRKRIIKNKTKQNMSSM